jgi:hypothetical protein
VQKEKEGVPAEGIGAQQKFGTCMILSWSNTHQMGTGAATQAR